MSSVEKKFQVTLHRHYDPETGNPVPSVSLLVHRTASECEALRQRGFRITAREVEETQANGHTNGNTRKPNEYSVALAAVAKLAAYAKGVGNDALANKAQTALAILLPNDLRG
jgi:hypothetical protein